MEFLDLLEIGGRFVGSQFHHPLQGSREVYGVPRVGGVMSCDGYTLRHRQLGLAHIQGAAFDGVRLCNLAEARVVEVGAQRLLRELSLNPQKVDAFLEFVGLDEDPLACLFKAVGTSVQTDGHRDAPVSNKAQRMLGHVGGCQVAM